MKAKNAFAVISTIIIAWSSKADPVIEWSAFHKNPVLEYSRVNRGSDCFIHEFDQRVELPKDQKVLDLSDWFKPGTAWRMRVAGDDTESWPICLVIGEPSFFYMGITGGDNEGKVRF